MKIAILSRSRRYYSTARLVEAARARGHHVTVVDYVRSVAEIGTDDPSVRTAGAALDRPDVVIPRVAISHSIHGLAILRRLEQHAVVTLNRAHSIAVARDKLHCLELLAIAGVPVPRSGIARDAADLRQLITRLGGPPVLVKRVSGTQGVGVVLTESAGAVLSVADALQDLRADVLLQEFVAESAGRDVRVLVLGGVVVAAMERIAQAGEFRANFHRGGDVAPTTLTDAEHAVAVAAATVTGLDLAGVDLLRSSRGPLVLEVNASPGLEGIERATGADLAAVVIEYCETTALRAPLQPR